jgi:hypothetical protein
LQVIVESAPKKRGNPYRDANGRLTSKANAVYDVRTKGGNPYHDKAGKFASKSSYVPGKWEKRTGHDAMVEDIEGSLLQEVSPEQQKINVAKKGPDWARKQAEFFASGLNPESTVTYKNGPHTIQFTGKADEASQKRFLTEFDRMQLKYPADKVNINVDAPHTFGEGVGGETTQGTGDMRINESVLTRKAWPGMPVSSSVTPSQYVLAHEWGHVIATPTEAKNKEVHRAAIDAGGLTGYGIRGVTGVLAPAEGYAEAFAEWSLTDGKTKNKAAIIYANRSRWGEKYGSN